MLNVDSQKIFGITKFVFVILIQTSQLHICVTTVIGRPCALIASLRVKQIGGYRYRNLGSQGWAKTQWIKDLSFI